jgi:hypothetical protein
MERQHPDNRINTKTYVTFQAGPSQIERLAELGVLSAAELEAGRNAGGMAVRVPAQLVAEFEQGQKSAVSTELPAPASLSSNPGNMEIFASNSQDAAAEIERLARWLDDAGLNGPARMFVSANRPLSFFASQFLLLVQPMSKLALGVNDQTGRYSRLLENRTNVDLLLARLDQLDDERRKVKAARQLAKKAKKERK